MSEELIPKNQRSIYAKVPMILGQQLKNQEIRDKGEKGYSHGMTVKENSELFEGLYQGAAKTVLEQEASDDLMKEIKERIEQDMLGNEKRLAIIYKTIEHYIDKESHQRSL